MKTTDLSITDLFDMQRELDAEIERKHPTQPGEDRLSKRILALLVEVGEWANEARSWKFWSKDKAPRIKEITKYPVYEYVAGELTLLRDEVVKNPLLEEGCDVLHFILSIGNELGFECVDAWEYPVHDESKEVAFIELFGKINVLHHLTQTQDEIDEIDFEAVFAVYLTVCKRLGIEWDELIAAYIAKNKVNFERQNSGY